MKAELTSAHLQGNTDLTVLATIKQGLIDGLDTRTYKTRLKVLLRTLHSLRASSREFSAIRPFSDTTERIRTIHSLRLAILEPEDKLLLAVTFDRPWEPYIRIIYRDVGPLLDVIFCNCEGYVSAYNHSVAEYFEWVRNAQIDAPFFYSTPGTTDDLLYLRKAEKLQRETAAADQAATALLLDDPSELARQTAIDNMTRPGDPLGDTEKLGLGALAALYRLTELYPADREDGGYLLRAAHEILREFRPPILDTSVRFPPGSDEYVRFEAQLEWFQRPAPATPPTPGNWLDYKDQDVQGGILKSYKNITHGCLVLLSAESPAQARAFLGALAVTAEGEVPGDGIYVNVALTWQGLQRLGVPQAELARFPKEFREGMEARAGLLGDVRGNHPRNWTLPPRNWPDAGAGAGVIARVELSEVDLVVQLRGTFAVNPGDDEMTPAHPLYALIAARCAKPGVKILSVQAMLRYHDAKGAMLDHFGFVDGISQPVVDDGGGPALRAVKRFWNNQVSRKRDYVSRGEVLCGYVNDSADEPLPESEAAYLANGTFLVVRKLREDVAALNAVLKKSADPDKVKAKMMGRSLDGTPLADPVAPDLNDFDYSMDPEGAKCPFQAHIRRANPRMPMPEKGRIPRVMRRAMSYGPLFDDKPAAERGLVFLAYNASLAEQFEVIQRWVSGANASGVFSGQADPLLGVPQRGDARVFRFMDATVQRVELDPGGADDQPLVRLEWGAYLFVPSLAVLKKIAALRDAAPSSDVKAGEKIVQKLLALERGGAPAAEVIAAWKACLEDFEAKLSGDAPAVWAAIREKHGGVLRTAYGVLVGSKELAMKVLRNVDGDYSIAGYQGRMRQSIGEMFLGMDDSADYRSQSKATNEAAMAVTDRDAFKDARDKAEGRLLALLLNTGETTFDTREFSDWVLQDLSDLWFDLPDRVAVVGGGWSWDPPSSRAPRCPGDFTSPSRYTFSPNPGAAAVEYGETQGQALRQGVLKFVEHWRAQNKLPTGRLSNPMFKAIADDDQLARTLAGVMMGFLPTVDGNLRSVLYEWMDERTLWRLQEALVADTDPDRHAAAGRVLREPLMRSMQRRPVPDMVWRTAVRAHRLEWEKIRKNDRIVVGLGSATQEDLEAGRLDVFPVFGGNRKAPAGSEPIPTHACPAYTMAMGTLLGILSALLEAGTLRPTASPTGINLRR